MRNYLLFALCCPLLLATHRLPAQNVSTTYDALSLEDLMNIKISVASIKELTPRESPGVISFISADEIQESGARDLIDILRLVPGFDFACDVQGIVGIGVRGNWAHEGKVLLLIDGQEMNEGLYSTIQLGNHYPVENIKHIEIIRGPGSAMYGGNAEYAVINIITNDAKDINGIKVSGLYGETANTFGHRALNLEAGEVFNDFSVSLNASGLQSKRSDRNYTDVFGNSYNMTNNSKLNDGFINLKLGYKNLKIKAIADWYHTAARDEYQEVLSKPVNLTFDSYFLEVKNEFNISSKLKIIPRINYRLQIPWRYVQTDPERVDGTPFDITNQRCQATLLFAYNPIEPFSISTGAEFFNDRSVKNLDNAVFKSTHTSTLSFNNTALFAQALYTNRYANLTAGVRYNINKLYDESLVPRFGITKVIGKFHMKMLYSKAFRAPSTMNIDPAPGIKPENTRVIELETGLQLNSDIFISANLFDIKTRNVIAYYYDTIVDFDGYINLPESGTSGIEFILRCKKPFGHFDFSGSYYSAQNRENLLNNNIPGNKGELLAFPKLKWSLNTGFNLSKKITWNITASLLSKRYAITATDVSTGEPEYNLLPVFCMLNTFINYRDIGVQGLSIGVGVNNILNQHEWYVQPYNSLHAPLPGLSREYSIRLCYALKQK